MNWIILIAAGLCEVGFTYCLGRAHAVWTGIGAVGAAVVGICVFGEAATFWRLFFLVTLVGSIVGLKTVS